jgi:hypothetical protein
MKIDKIGKINQIKKIIKNTKVFKKCKNNEIEIKMILKGIA